jgi:enediyne biosynthesis protein E4
MYKAATNLGKVLVFTIILACFSCKNSDKTVFTLLSPDNTHVTFNNKITDSDTFNILTYEYIYNGGGVALADFDNDGLDEILFTGNMVPSVLYKNKGKLEFEDITTNSGFNTMGKWCTGTNIVDINQDGRKDVFLTVTTNKNPEKRKDLLFINETEKGKIKFTEQAAKYGLADSSYSMNSSFFDYDNDGDLDLLLINNKMDKDDVSRYRLAKDDRSSGKVDKLYRNDYDSQKGHPVFTDVSEQAGIKHEGYSLGVKISDINNDGWKDIYISNDFLSNDLLYINNRNGTFTNKLHQYLSHTSYSEMGNDIVDINNDGLQDIIAVDMLPYDNYRKKTMMGPNNYTNYTNNKSFDYTHQLVRNTLQLNMGNKPGTNEPIFSEIACFAGIQATDWSWAPLVADFDGDGLRDVIITNGFPKDITDKDFMDYQQEFGAYETTADMLAKVPEVKMKNFAFKNKGNLTFANVSEQWGITEASFSNGAAYSDLDNDGDLDYVINNINETAHIYRNNTANNHKTNYIKLKLTGAKPNIDALGTVINFKTKNIKSTHEHYVSRGYLSSMTNDVFLSLGTDSLVNLEIIWPTGHVQYMNNVASNKTYEVKLDSLKLQKYNYSKKTPTPYFIPNTAIAADTTLETDFVDYNFDPLLLKKLSDLGPGIAVGDANNDGQDDYYLAGGRGGKGRLYLQKNGRFVLDQNLINNKEKEELAPLFLDIDQDGDEDLYIGCGSVEVKRADVTLKDRLLINEGGRFNDVSAILPIPNTNTACVKACDYDADGDLDLFVGGGTVPSQYPKAEPSYILKNNSKPGQLKFSIDTGTFANLNTLVTDAIWSDYDLDGYTDLLIVGQYEGLKIYKNNRGKLTPQNNSQTGNTKGIFNSINAADFDHDGDYDYVLGNYGLNGLAKASLEHPMRLYAKDFDGNGTFDFIPTVYFPNKENKLDETPFHVKGDLTRELNSFRKNFVSYSKLANASIDSIITPKMRENALVLECNQLASLLVENKGNGLFVPHVLPKIAQFAPLYGSQILDINNDGNLDIIFVGNNHEGEQTTGILDANLGTVLLGNGKLAFSTLLPAQSGILLRTNSRAIGQIFVENQGICQVATANNGAINGFKLSKPNLKYHKVQQGTRWIQFVDASGKTISKQEIYWGNGYMSQNTRKTPVPPLAHKIEIYNYKNTKQEIIL